MKVVIHTWTHKFNINPIHVSKYNYYNETNFFFGLGDLIRSTIKLFYLSKKMNFKLIVDLQLHPISQFIKIKNHEYSSAVVENKNNIDYVCYGGLEDYINESTTDLLFILTNDFFDGIITEDCKIFIKELLRPNDKFKNFIRNKLKTIPFKQYNILHYRLSDSEFLNKPSSIIVEENLTHLIHVKEANDILITDMNTFKNYVFLKDDIFMFNTKICHLGLSNDADEIRDTLFEFFLLSRAKKIKTHCKIHAISGFVKWVGLIYDIPVKVV
jgi:hypothetical protein